MDLMGVLLETFSPRRSAEVAGQVHRTPWCVGRLAGAPLPSQCLQQSLGSNHADCAIGKGKQANVEKQLGTTTCCQAIIPWLMYQHSGSHLMTHTTSAVILHVCGHLPLCCGAQLPCLTQVRVTQCQSGGNA